VQINLNLKQKITFTQSEEIPLIKSLSMIQKISPFNRGTPHLFTRAPQSMEQTKVLPARIQESIV
jgi:hypothetical protein